MLAGFAQRATERGGRALQRAPVFTCKPSGRENRQDQVTVGHVGTSPAGSLTVSFHDFLHGADSVSVGPLLHHRLRNGLQLKRQQIKLVNTQLVKGAGFTGHPNHSPTFDAHSVLLVLLLINEACATAPDFSRSLMKPDDSKRLPSVRSEKRHQLL